MMRSVERQYVEYTVDALTEALSSDRNVESFPIAISLKKGKNIPVTQLERLVSLLIVPTNLKASKIIDLKFSNCGLEGGRAGNVLAELIAKKPGLIQLNLKKNNLGDEGCSALARALSRSKLEKLSLKENNLSSQGAAEIFTQWKATPTLRSINLKKNKIDSSAMPQLAGVLVAGNVDKISLTRNPIGDDGTRILAHALPTARQLTKLNLTNTGITDLGCQDLITAVDKLDNLQELRLNGNDSITRSSTMMLNQYAAKQRISNVTMKLPKALEGAIQGTGSCTIKFGK